MRVSVILTVFNEGASIGRLLDSLKSQTRTPDEIVVVDGGSTDQTVETLRTEAKNGSLSLRVLVEPGANISRGRNLAIQAAANELIASTDAGVQLSEEWLAEICAPLDAGQCQVVSGVFVPEVHTVFEIAMGATVLPTLAEINPERFLPSSRSVAFTRSAWQTVGGYPEWLDYCEDLIFDIRLRQRFAPFGFAPEAVAHFRPRGDLRSFFKQYYRYARGDGKANLFWKRHLIRYGSYLVALPLLILAGLWISPWLWVAGLLLAGIGYLTVPYRRLWPHLAGLSLPEMVAAILWVPVIRFTGDVAKMIGYPVGWMWRLRHRRHQSELDWRAFPTTKNTGAPG
jgi:glycosyltransferase involved in cell wall biosynthesis